jgi:hypothetical protein
MRRETLHYCMLGCLVCAFAAVSALVFVSRGNSTLIRAKLKVGGLLLSLTATATTGTACVTCYEDTFSNQIIINNPVPTQGQLIVDISSQNEIEGQILNRSLDNFSFQVLRAENPCPEPTDEACEIQLGEVQALDGAMDENEEDFSISLDANIPCGEHELRIYGTSVQAVEAGEQSHPLYRSALIVEGCVEDSEQ